MNLLQVFISKEQSQSHRRGQRKVDSVRSTTGFIQSECSQSSVSIELVAISCSTASQSSIFDTGQGQSGTIDRQTTAGHCQSIGTVRSNDANGIRPSQTIQRQRETHRKRAQVRDGTSIGRPCHGHETCRRSAGVGDNKSIAVDCAINRINFG